jgi:hypothetical protein
MGRWRLLLTPGLMTALVLLFIGIGVATSLIPKRVTKRHGIGNESGISQLPIPKRVGMALSATHNVADATKKYLHHKQGEVPPQIGDVLGYANRPSGWRDVFTYNEASSSVEHFRPLGFIIRDRSVDIYSIGPDGVDNSALLAYDPTNGICSSGDIIVRVPSEGTWGEEPEIP